MSRLIDEVSWEFSKSKEILTAWENAIITGVGGEVKNLIYPFITRVLNVFEKGEGMKN